MELPFPEFEETCSVLFVFLLWWKKLIGEMSPENSGEVVSKERAILREKGSARAQQSWQLHGTGSGLCEEGVGMVESA